MATKKISLRIDVDLYNGIAKRANDNGVTISKQIQKELRADTAVNMDARKADEVASGLIVLTAELNRMRAELNKIGKNVNDMAKYTNAMMRVKRVWSQQSAEQLEKNSVVFVTWMKKVADDVDDWKKRAEDLWRTLK